VGRFFGDRDLSGQRIGLAVILPCDRTKDLCPLITALTPEIYLNRGEDGVGFCAGGLSRGDPA